MCVCVHCTPTKITKSRMAVGSLDFTQNKNKTTKIKIQKKETHKWRNETKEGKKEEKNAELFFYSNATYKVLDAKFVSSCFNWPSSAKPHLSLLFANRGVNVKTFESVNPGCTWHPSLYWVKIKWKKKTKKK